MHMPPNTLKYRRVMPRVMRQRFEMQAQYSLAVSLRYHSVITPLVRTTFFPQVDVHATAVV
jgi:hypothetical protein